MTAGQLLAVLLRRWYLLVVGLCLVVFVADRLSSQRADYSADVHVLFYAPAVPHDPNSLLNANSGAIALAGVTQLAVTGSDATARSTTLDTVTLLDDGIYDGSSVILPNSGGQWAYNFNQAVLDVQVTGHTVDEVRHSMAMLLSRVQTEARDRQEAADTASSQIIRTVLSPTSIDVRQGEGSRVRVYIGTVTLGLGAILAIATSIGRVSQDRGRRGVGARQMRWL